MQVMHYCLLTLKNDLDKLDRVWTLVSCLQAQPLLLTGHRDGRVRMWDMSCEVPRLLGTAPHDMGGPGSRLQAVSVIKVHSLLALLDRRLL